MKMKNLVRILGGLSLSLLLLSFAQGDSKPKSIHSLCANSIEGEKVCMSQFKGKKIMIVNTASKCGYTPQYEDLEKLYQKYKDQNFVIIGFPANDFMGQEPGSNEEIAAFCQKNYGVSFPMMEKITVKGNDIHPIYKFLTELSENGVMDTKVKWNFQKYLINEKGELEKVFYSGTKPMDKEIIDWITQK
jgi:glutathione peroxidase